MLLRLKPFHPLMQKIALLSASLAIAFTVLHACQSEEQSSNDENASDMLIKGFSFTLCESGKETLEVKSEVARMPIDQSKVFLKNVRIAQLQDGVSSGTITAREGIYFLRGDGPTGRQGQDLMLKGRVLVKRPDGFMLSTEEAIIQSAEKRLLANASSRFHVPLQNGGVLEGRSAHFELGLMDGFNTVNLRLGKEDFLGKGAVAAKRKIKSSVKILSSRGSAPTTKGQMQVPGQRAKRP